MTNFLQNPVFALMILVSDTGAKPTPIICVMLWELTTAELETTKTMITVASISLGTKKSVVSTLQCQITNIKHFINLIVNQEKHHNTLFTCATK